MYGFKNMIYPSATKLLTSTLCHIKICFLKRGCKVFKCKVISLKQFKQGLFFWPIIYSLSWIMVQNVFTVPC